MQANVFKAEQGLYSPEQHCTTERLRAESVGIRGDIVREEVAVFIQNMKQKITQSEARTTVGSMN